MKYLIRNRKYNNYFNSQIDKNMFHFVEDIEEAYIFPNKKELNRFMKQFKNPDKLSIEVFKVYKK